MCNLLFVRLHMYYLPKDRIYNHFIKLNYFSNEKQINALCSTGLCYAKVYP